MFDNKVEQVKHLPLKIDEVARYVIVPGDPNRVEIIASVFDEYKLWEAIESLTLQEELIKVQMYL